MVPYAGWDMPVEYSGIGDEHMAVRTRAGLFDVSHMGEIEVAGTDALRALQRVTSNDVSKLAVGRAQYSGLMTDVGTFLDDVLIYRLGPEHFLLVVNAGNTAKDHHWLARQCAEFGDVLSVDVSARYALLAVQGPAALEAVQPLTGVNLQTLGYYSFAHGEVSGVRATVSRTGYTGEDGFEILLPSQSAETVWHAILHSGNAVGVVPAGLGARDTLRLEAGMRLYGHDIDETTTPLEAGLGWMVAWGKGVFNGSARLQEQKAHGVTRTLVGFELVDAGIARPGHGVFVGETAVGVVTSGTRTPFLKKAIGMAYVPPGHATPGSELHIDVRGRRVSARVVAMPFYKRTA